jgi:hypothetical protein
VIKMADMLILAGVKGSVEDAQRRIQSYEGVTRVRFAYGLPGGDGFVIEASGNEAQLSKLYLDLNRDTSLVDVNGYRFADESVLV